MWLQKGLNGVWFLQEKSLFEERARDAGEEHERKVKQLRIEIESVEEDLRREKEVNSRAAMVSQWEKGGEGGREGGRGKG